MIYLLAIVLPPLAMFLRGHVFQSLLCIILMLTVLGWPIAAVWAILVVKRDEDERRHLELMTGRRW